MTMQKTSRLVFTIIVSNLLLISQVNAAESTVPVYPSGADANNAFYHAATVAEQNNPELQAQMNNLMAAEKQLQHMTSTGTKQQIQKSENNLNHAEMSFSTTLSEMSGVSMPELNDMNSNGMSWEQISNEMGVRVDGMTQNRSRSDGTNNQHSTNASMGSGNGMGSNPGNERQGPN